MKGLIKHELRNVWATLIYMLLAMGLWVYVIYSEANSIYYTFTQRGYQSYNHVTIGDILERGLVVYMIGVMIGIMILLYMQFKDNKSIQTSGFIKALPYTNGQIGSIKLAVGTGVITVPFALAMIAIGSIIKSISPMFEFYIKVSPVGEELIPYSKMSYFLIVMLLIYSVTLVVYLMGFFSQYLINGNIASIVTSISAIFAMPGILSGWIMFIDRTPLRDLINNNAVVEDTYYRFTEFIPRLFLPIYLLSQNKWYDVRSIEGVDSERIESIRITTFGNVNARLVLIGVLISILLLSIYCCIKSYRAETQEQFSSYKAINRIFVIGVTLSAISLWIGIERVFFYRTSNILLYIGMLISGVLAYNIAKRLTNR